MLARVTARKTLIEAFAISFHLTELLLGCKKVYIITDKPMMCTYVFKFTLL